MEVEVEVELKVKGLERAGCCDLGLDMNRIEVAYARARDKMSYKIYRSIYVCICMLS